MSRRQRFLNPAHLGCQVALDARFITGIANGGAVATWTGRANTSINATQGTVANQPSFQTAGINGNPTVRFDGTNDVLSATPDPDFPYSIFVVVATSDANGTIASDSRITGSFLSEGLFTVSGNLNLSQQNGAASTLSISSTSTNPMIATGTFSGNNTSFSGTLRRNGATVAGPTAGTGVRDSTAVARVLRLGDVPGASFPLAGDISAVVLFPGTITDPVCKRIEQALSASFKIAIS